MRSQIRGNATTILPWYGCLDQNRSPLPPIKFACFYEPQEEIPNVADQHSKSTNDSSVLKWTTLYLYGKSDRRLCKSRPGSRKRFLMAGVVDDHSFCFSFFGFTHGRTLPSCPRKQDTMFVKIRWAELKYYQNLDTEGRMQACAEVCQ